MNDKRYEIGVFDQAILFCIEKSGKTREEILNYLEDPADDWLPATFRYGLAEALKKYLTARNSTIKAIYIFGSSVSGTKCPTADIDLILWVSQKTEELNSLLKDIDRFLTDEYTERVGGRAKGLKHLLDLKIVNDEDVEYGRNCSCLINGVYDRAIKL